MGVPAFYRWLTNKYPNTVVNAVEDQEDQGIPVMDSSSFLPNPNGMEFDNLYLDMNAIIHPCFHPDNDQPFPPVTFEDVFNNMFEYIDRLFNIVRPRKLLYMAIDGVAPRAKMNQQRARRFQTSKHYEVAEIQEERLRIQFQLEGKEVLPKTESELSDSNVITPGTEFMYRLSKELQSYICIRINNDPGWKDIKVILSDANVPGEGEHKIMSFIRLQRTSPDNDPNTRHCLYGLDADLIMLALASHEVHFSVLREDVLVQEQKPSCESALEISLQEADEEKGSSNSKQQEQDSASAIAGPVDAVKRRSTLIKKPYQFLHIWILREYLELDMQVGIPPEKFDLERVIDDFIFICFFVGNDFLPHIPTMEIHEGAIDLLMHVYKTEFNDLGGYLVDMERAEDKKAGYIKLSRVEKFILKVGSYEEKIFKKRSALRERKQRRILADWEENRDAEERELDATFETNSCTNGRTISDVKGVSFIDSSVVSDENRKCQILQNTKDLKEKLKDYIRKESDAFKNGGLGTDKVRLGSPGWKERYYKLKFSAETPEEIEAIRKSVVEKYTEGLCWVLQYYFSGVPSWTWFFPYHYGPFASDMKRLAQTRVNFQEGSPFKPFDQLLGVLPPRSAHALPLAYQPLMSDETSEIIDFYPRDLEVDIDGKRFMWQGICKLSFIDEQRLLAVTRKLEKELNENEAMRNAKNIDQLFVRSSSKLGSQIMLVCKNKATTKQNDSIKIDTILSEGLNGFMALKLDNSNTADFYGPNEDIQEHNVLCVYYDVPPQCQFIPRLLEGVNVPEKTISESDIEETQLWHEYQGSRPSNSNYRIQYQQRPQQAYNISKFTSPHTSSPVIYKPVGTGFTTGRGKPPTTTAPPIETSKGAVGICTRGIQELKISDTSRGFESYGRAHQQLNNNFWTSNSFATAVSNRSNEWRPNVQYDRNYGAATSIQGRGSHEWRPNVQTNAQDERNYGAATSIQGRGSRQWGPSLQSNAREKGDYRAATSIQGRGSREWRPNVQSNVWDDRNYGAATSIQGRGSREWRPNVQSNAWDDRNYGAATSIQGRGSHEWRPNVQSNAVVDRNYSAATSIQGRGSREWGPNVQSNARDDRNYGAATSIQGRGSHQWRPNVQTNARDYRNYGAANSIQGRGSCEWRPNVPNAVDDRNYSAATSFQGRGSREWRPNAQTNARDDRNYGAATSIQGRGSREWGPSLQTNARQNREYVAATSIQGPEP